MQVATSRPMCISAAAPESSTAAFLGRNTPRLSLGAAVDEALPARRRPVSRWRTLAPSEDISQGQQAMRLALAGELRGLSAVSGGSQVVDALDSANDRALRLMRPEAAAAFDLEQESKTLRETYGAGSFGQGCLMARRLVERGVSFVEVVLDGWDTHNNNFERVKELSQQLDSGFAALLADLNSAGCSNKRSWFARASSVVRPRSTDNRDATIGPLLGPP